MRHLYLVGRDDRKDVCLCGHKREHHHLTELLKMMWQPCVVSGCYCTAFDYQKEAS